ncbi:baculoviral IAP repeat-containing protein 7-A-like isoform X2 [Dreissena polymorpha]|uniref:baculoviral IAP repeat-containing protein 7-A-like isoform X2 n=1 Tax=Dreissena polymorpha TaxID=45954 RepID=UPI00226503DD|nr:baculoviral IAP repeat-containing protein 7-A-like isoform X2 [Dreissena polymorpha]
MAELSLISTSSSGNESGRFSSNGRGLQIQHDLEEDSAPIVRLYSHPQGIDDEITDDVVAEDYAPDPRDYYSHFYRESERLSTFHDWPPWAHVTMEELAQNGFMYLHVSDRVQCVFCRACLASFEPGDVVANEHRKYCPECPFAFGYECGNIPIPSASRIQQTARQTTLKEIDSRRPTAAGNFAFLSPPFSSFRTTSVSTRTANPIALPQSHSVTALSSVDPNQGAAAVITEPKYRDWADEHTRLRSYRGWPAQLRQTPRDLAAAGLLYMGQGDRCKCYWCGGELYDWDPEDLPWVEHAKWFQQCGFVRQQMGEQFVINVKNGVTTNVESPSNQEFLRRPHVLASLNDYRYTREQVLEALHTYGVLNLVTAQDIRKYVEELTRKRQVALMHAGLTENVTYANLRQSSHLVKGSDSSFAVSAGGQQVAQPSDEAGASNGQLCIEDLAMEGVEESNTDSINYRRLQNLSLNAHSSSLSSASIPSDVDDVLKENEKLKEQRVCKVCMDREVCVTFLPCRHLATCEECGESISTCPICRSDVESKVKVYWA